MYKLLHCCLPPRERRLGQKNAKMSYFRLQERQSFQNKKVKFSASRGSIKVKDKKVVDRKIHMYRLLLLILKRMIVRIIEAHKLC
uniref:Uncharacterized protein n=1 Tax=Lotus japonicus TaxID=34305 RepID=I3SI89_LOTJA|nr:unknown [Lotus japonicus]